MGRVNLSSQPEDEDDQSCVIHFSHEHPLQLITSSRSQSCSACSLEASSGAVYTCMQCSFCLHPKCFEMPQQKTHPFDKSHVLSLLPKPAYPEGIFRCDGCGKQGNGFSYHCQTCAIDLDVNCASLPLILSHSSHHHQLSLAFSPPYPEKKFSCDLCRKIGSKHWLYHCSACHFDIHLACITRTQTPNTSLINQTSAMAHNNHLTHIRPPAAIEMANIHRQSFVSSPAMVANGFMNSLVNGLASGASQAATQAIIQEITGSDQSA